MDKSALINLAINSVIASSSIIYILCLFGNPKNPIWNNPVKAILAKIGLTFIFCGCLLNVLTLTVVPPSQMVLNFGLAISFCLLALIEYSKRK